MGGEGKEIASSDAISTTVIKNAVNRPSWFAAPAKSPLIFSSSLSVVFINHKVNTQAEKDC